LTHQICAREGCLPGSWGTRFQAPKSNGVEVPLELATGVWRRLVTGADGLLDRRAYTFCVLERLREALRRRDVFAPASKPGGEPAEPEPADAGDRTETRDRGHTALVVVFERLAIRHPGQSGLR